MGEHLKHGIIDSDTKKDLATVAPCSCRDFQAFRKAGLTDKREIIGNYNLFMVCETPNTSAFRELPEGYSFRFCRRDELEVWKCLVVEEQYIDYLTGFYERVYAKNEDEFFYRCLFVCDADDRPVGSSFIWHSYGRINTVGWLRVLPEYEGKGLGRAILSEVLKTTQGPVYLHTQPTSICAIKLYSDFGFSLITNPIVGYRKNNLVESMQYLQQLMPEADYARLRFVEIDDSLHRAALSSEIAEF